MVFGSSLAETYPPTINRRPRSKAHGEKVNGVSASWCHTLALVTNDKIFSHAVRDSGWQDRRRAANEQVNTDLEYFIGAKFLPF